MKNFNKELRDKYWKNFFVENGKDDLIYHLSGADKDISLSDNVIAREKLLYYYYRFLIEDRILLKYLKKYFNGNDFLALDAGCGTGRASLVLSKYFEKVDAFDISDKFINQNKIRYKAKEKINFFVSDFNDLGISKEKYDLIFVGGVFMCMSEDEFKKSLQKIKKILKNNGLLIVRDTLSKDNTKNVSEIKIYRSESDHENTFAGEGFILDKKLNGATRNFFCSLFNRLPKKMQNNNHVFEFFKFCIKLFLFIDSFFIFKKGKARHKLANQIYYFFRKI